MNNYVILTDSGTDLTKEMAAECGVEIIDLTVSIEGMEPVANSDVEVIENLVDRMRDASFVTVFYGEKISEDAAEVVLSIIKSKLPADTEVTLIRGGQPIYDYIISAE